MVSPNLVQFPIFQIFNNGVPLNGGKVFFYSTGTNTKLSIFSDVNLSVSLPNPIILDSNGRASASNAVVGVYWAANTIGKIVVSPSTDTDPPTSPLFTVDPVYGEDPLSLSPYFTATNATTVTLNSGKVLALTGSLSVTQLNDSNGNAILTFNAAGSSVNNIQISDAATTTPPIIAPVGSDSAIAIRINQLGAKPIILGTTSCTGVQLGNNESLLDSNANALLSFTSIASSVNNLNLTNAATTGSVIVGTAGSDSAPPLNITNKGGGATNLTNNALNYAAPVTIASAASVAIGGAASNNIIISGTNTITSFDTVAAGIIREVKFSGAATLTYNSTSLILPGTANIITAANDTATFLSLGSGNWICSAYIRAVSEIPTSAPIYFTKVTSYTTAATNTFNIPTGVNMILAEGWGAGGGGGGTSSAGYGGGGGGGGGYFKKLLAIPIGTTALTVITGAAGTAGANTGGNGGTGGTTSIAGTGITTLTAIGGTGGTGTTGVARAAGGAGGTASNGDINISGGTGGYGGVISGAGNSFVGMGGIAPMGGVGTPFVFLGTSGVAGINATNNGDGGGGSGGFGTSAQIGGTGAPGMVILTY